MFLIVFREYHRVWVFDSCSKKKKKKKKRNKNNKRNNIQWFNAKTLYFLLWMRYLSFIMQYVKKSKSRLLFLGNRKKKKGYHYAKTHYPFFVSLSSFLLFFFILSFFLLQLLLTPFPLYIITVSNFFTVSFSYFKNLFFFKKIVKHFFINSYNSNNINQ